MVKFWLKNILPLHKNILKPINSNKIVKGIALAALHRVQGGHRTTLAWKKLLLFCTSFKNL